MKYKLAIFDLDGTILNTIEDLADSLNYALAEAGLPARTLPQVMSFVGNGIRKLIERGCPEGSKEETVSHVHQIFTAYYKDHCMDKTCPYEGVLDLLDELRDEGLTLAVLSNKADYATQVLIKEMFPGRFQLIAGEKEAQGIRKKPAPDAINIMLDELGLKPEEAVYIGDSEVDIQTAANAKMDCISVLWGFRDEQLLRSLGQKTFAHNMEELYELLK